MSSDKRVRVWALPDPGPEERESGLWEGGGGGGEEGFGEDGEGEAVRV